MDDIAPTFDWTAFWAGVGTFLNAWEPLVRVVSVLVIAFIANGVLRYMIRRVVDRVVNGAKKRHGVQDTQALIASPLAAARLVQRARALGSVFTNAVTSMIVILVILLLVSILFPNATAAFALISAALGAGLGFGAQNVVKDVLNGIFMVAEDQLGVGDTVDLGLATGTVEEVGLRVTKVRSTDGVLWFVRNGEILRTGNYSQGWARVIIDLPAPYSADIAEIQHTLLQTAETLANSAAWKPKIIEKPEIWGVESISAEAIVIRLAMKTRPEEQWDVARELRIRLKHAMDEINVNLPVLNRVVIDDRGATPKPKPNQQPSKAKPLPATDQSDTE